jgi:uncharacterized membrane protein
MRTELIFFETKYESKRGTVRGAVALGCLTVLTFLWYGVAMKSFYKGRIDNVSPANFWVGIIVSAFLIISAIGVQLPTNAQTALVYGGLLGAVIYGVSNGTLLMVSNKWTIGLATLDVLWGILSTTMISFLIYRIFF